MKQTIADPTIDTPALMKKPRLMADRPLRSLSRGLVLVKWWLLALPHYLVVAVFAGGAWASWSGAATWGDVANGGLIGLLVFFIGVALLFTGSYPRSLYDFVMGMNRWCFRVLAYSALLTDAYPPLRLDLGGEEPAAPEKAPLVPAATG